MSIQIQVRNKVAVNLTPEEVIVCGNSGYKVEFVFDDEWASEAVKTARFVYRKGGQNYFEDVVFSGTIVNVPVLSNINYVLVGVYAGDLITTTPAVVECDKSILCGSGTHKEPTPDVYFQLLEHLERIDSKVKSVNGISPDEKGNVEIEVPSGGQSENFVIGAGEPFFTHTATFATDAAAERGAIVDGASISSLLDTVYWLEVNGELYKCHWERDLFMVYLYDEDGNRWMANTVNGIYVNAQTAGTYTFKLYAPSEELMLAPRYLPPNIATKGDIPRKASPVADAAGDTVTGAEFNALMAALRNAGYLET